MNDEWRRNSLSHRSQKIHKKKRLQTYNEIKIDYNKCNKTTGKNINSRWRKLAYLMSQGEASGKDGVVKMMLPW